MDPVSRLVLGTAQIGLAYGIANRRGRPRARDAARLLDAAARLGIAALDTARGYGLAEARIGRWLALSGARPTVVTKFPPVDDADALAAALAASRRALGRERLDLVLAHRARDLGRPGIVAHLRSEVAAGRIGGFGASVYSPAEARALLAIDGLAAIQAPVSVFDRRFVTGDLPARLAARGIALQARSVFLQGVVAMAPDALPSHLAPLARPLARLRDAARAQGRPAVALALQAVLAEPAVATVVIGADSIRQLAASVGAARQVADLAAVAGLSRGLPAAAINPALWPAEPPTGAAAP